MSQHTDPPADASVEQHIAVETGTVGENTVLTVTGEIDMGTSPQLRSALSRVLDDVGSALIVDLSAVEFLGSSGLAVLVETHDAAAGRGIALRLVCRSREVVRPLEATGLTELFEVHPDLDAALGH